MSHRTRRFTMKNALLLLAAAGVGTPALAQNYPVKPVNLIINMPPAGGSDILGRVIAEKLSGKWNQPVVVINKASAGGIIGLEEVARAAPDGYTLGTTTNGLVETPFLSKDVSWKTADFVPISLTSSGPGIVAVTASFHVRSLQELIAYARANPGKVNYASAGPGPSRMAVENFMMITKINMTEIPYKGVAAMTLGLLAGEAQVQFDAATSVKPQVDQGKFVALAVADSKRLFLMPNVPTTAELGLPEFTATFWKGIVGPAKMQRDVVDKIARDINEVLSRPDVSDFVKNRTGAEAIGSTPAEFQKFVEQQTAVLQRVMARMKIQQ